MWTKLKQALAFLRDVKEIEIASEPPKEVAGASGGNPLCIDCQHMFKTVEPSITSRTGDSYMCMHPKSRSEWPDLVTGIGETNVTYLPCNKARHARVLCGPTGKWWEDRMQVEAPEKESLCGEAA